MKSSKESVTRERHIGERGKHRGHVLELLEQGIIYCNDCEKPISFKSADIAWPAEDQGVQS